MSQAGLAIVPQRLGRKTIAIERRRVILTTRVLPATMEYLEGLQADDSGMKCETRGRAIDFLVRAVQHPGILENLHRTGKLQAINLAG